MALENRGLTLDEDCNGRFVRVAGVRELPVNRVTEQLKKVNFCAYLDVTRTAGMNYVDIVLHARRSRSSLLPGIGLWPATRSSDERAPIEDPADIGKY